MTTKEIIDAVINYVSDENAKYAILIDGAWGSGKTYLYENYLLDAIDSKERRKKVRRHNVYISLYGISTIASLAKQLIVNYLVYVKANGNKLVKKGIKPFTGIIGVASSAFSFSLGPVSTDFSKLFNNINNNIDVKNLVICFDDLERCTIPINEFFGFVNNLIEHCNCKVLILADERNIGKIYANTNIEEKYLTVLSGNRRVVECIDNGKDARTQRTGLGGSQGEEITIEEVKKLNELLYSENYLYKDIKEKVIGKTMLYYPDLKDVVEELVSGSKRNKGIIQDSPYKDFLLNHINEIVSALTETDNRNLRIIKSWVFSFRTIYDTTTKYFSENKYYEDILNDFLRYSIWVVGALKKNKKITKSSIYRNQDMVFFEGQEYTHIYKYNFIDSWINRGVWNDEDLCQACKSIIKRRKRDDVDNPPKVISTGKCLSELREWYYMEDGQVRDILNRLEDELKENKYAYYDYSNILYFLLYLQERELYAGDLGNIRDIMISLIKRDDCIQEDDDFPKEFPSEEMRNRYNGLYRPISEERKMRNRALSKQDMAVENIYSNADAFYEHCCNMENFYCFHGAFLEYVDFEKLFTLINESDNKGLYTICRAFKRIYHMGNLKEFYIADIDGLKRIREYLISDSVIKHSGITRKIALEKFGDVIKQDLILLGVDEEQT